MPQEVRSRPAELEKCFQGARVQKKMISRIAPALIALGNGCFERVPHAKLHLAMEVPEPPPTPTLWRDK